MTVMAPTGWWILGYVLGAVVVVIVAVLLVTILLVARNIESLAGQALAVAGGIVAATKSIWLLPHANDIVGEIAGATSSIEARITAIANELAPTNDSNQGGVA